MPNPATFEMLLPIIPSEGQESHIRNIIQKLKDVERKEGGLRDLTSCIAS